MRPAAVRAKTFFLRHRWFFLLALGSLVLRWKLPGLFLGAALGGFLDSFFWERQKTRETEAYLFTGTSEIFCEEEKGELALAYLYFRFLDLAGVPFELFREKQASLVNAGLSPAGAKNRFAWDRVRRIVRKNPAKAGPEPAGADKVALAELDSRLTTAEKKEFLKRLAGDFLQTKNSEERKPFTELFAFTVFSWKMPQEEIRGLFPSLITEDDPWQILGLRPGAPPEEVRKNYRFLAAQFHPDTLGDLSAEQKKQANEAFLKISRAYHLLGEN